MKVIEIYDKNSIILDHGKNVFKTMDYYLRKFPESYRKCYDKNLETLELLKVDRLNDASLNAVNKSKQSFYKYLNKTYNNNSIGLNYNYSLYIPEDNIIIFEKNYSLGHELFHMCSNDRDNEQFAFESALEIEDGLIEGMTEYHHMKAFGLKEPGAYSFEVFTVTMLENIPNLFESFFVPKTKGILDVCPNRKALYGLLYSLSMYNDMLLKYLAAAYTDEDALFSMTKAKRTIKHTIDNLISIELTVEKNEHNLKEYSEKFMGLISSSFVGDVLPELYPNYDEYAEKQLKKRIKERI